MAPSKIVSGKYWCLTISGEVPTGVSAEQWGAIIHNNLGIGAAIMPMVNQLHYETRGEPFRFTDDGNGNSPLHLS